TTATVAGIILMGSPDHLRLRFLYFNGSVLGIVVCLTLDLFQIPAPSGDINQAIANLLSCLRQIEPMQAAFLVLLTVSLLDTHRAILVSSRR
ncbi:hypothetical protein, partial [Roseibium sp.]|uniref:hypothetical protein n=1 Tax=Roseibium sp. TaxID=1936156 RepID=UPI003D10D89E